VGTGGSTVGFAGSGSAGGGFCGAVVDGLLGSGLGVAGVGMAGVAGGALCEGCFLGSVMVSASFSNLARMPSTLQSEGSWRSFWKRLHLLPSNGRSPRVRRWRWLSTNTRISSLLNPARHVPIYIQIDHVRVHVIADSCMQRDELKK
jgi:hypothetical protein